MSSNAQLCASLVSDGFDGEPANRKTKLHAISSEFDLGFSRLKQFFSVLRPLVVDTSPDLTTELDEAVTFLESHRDRYLLLETIELDCMMHEGEAALRGCVEAEINNCLSVGMAVDALSRNPTEAGKRLREATQRKLEPPLDGFYGLRLDDDYDNIRDDKTEYPLGLEWTDVLYFQLWNRAQFEANH
jgi:hypothetical protein